MSSSESNNNSVEESQNQQNQQQAIDQGTGQADNTNPQQEDNKPTFDQFKQMQQQQQQPASNVVGVNYDANGNAIFPPTDTIGNENRSRGIIGSKQGQPATSYPGTSGASRYDHINPPSRNTDNNLGGQVQRVNPTTPEELEQLIKEQQEQTRLNQEASEERMKMYRIEMQGQYYTPPQHLTHHPYLAERKLKPNEVQAQKQTTQQKLEQGEEVISITDEQPVEQPQQQDQQNQQIQPNQIRNGIENLIPSQQQDEQQQQQ